MPLSLLRQTIIENLYEPIRAAVDVQKSRGATWEELSGCKKLIGIRVPQWYLAALTATSSSSPAKYMGLPIEAGEHEEIVAVWWDPSMSLETPGVPVSVK